MNKLPEASSTKAGIVTTGSQILAGDKTVVGNLVIDPGHVDIKHATDAYLSLWEGAVERWRIQSTGATNGLDIIYQAGSITPGGISAAGAWTIGPSGFSGTHTVNGILNANKGLTGRLDGSAVPAGQIGEKLDFTNRSISAVTGSVTANASPLVTLTPGIWMLYWQANVTAATSATDIENFLSTNGNNDNTGYLLAGGSSAAAARNTQGQTGGTWFVTGTPVYYIATTNTSIYAKSISYGAARSVTFIGYAVRQA